MQRMALSCLSTRTHGILPKVRVLLISLLMEMLDSQCASSRDLPCVGDSGVQGVLIRAGGYCGRFWSLAVSGRVAGSAKDEFWKSSSAVVPAAKAKCQKNRQAC